MGPCRASQGPLGRAPAPLSLLQVLVQAEEDDVGGLQSPSAYLCMHRRPHGGVEAIYRRSMRHFSRRGPLVPLDPRRSGSWVADMIWYVNLGARPRSPRAIACGVARAPAAHPRGGFPPSRGAREAPFSGAGGPLYCALLARRAAGWGAEGWKGHSLCRASLPGVVASSSLPLPLRTAQRGMRSVPRPTCRGAYSHIRE